MVCVPPSMLWTSFGDGSFAILKLREKVDTVQQARQSSEQHFPVQKAQNPGNYTSISTTINIRPSVTDIAIDLSNFSWRILFSTLFFDYQIGMKPAKGAQTSQEYFSQYSIFNKQNQAFNLQPIVNLTRAT